MRLLAVDVVVVLVLVGGGAALVTAWVAQHAHDDDAAAAASLAHQHGGRLVWPADRRQGVSSLLDAGTQPVLAEGPVAPQQLALWGTAVVIGTPEQPLPSFSLREQPVGDLVAHVVDLDRAGQVPLAPGETIGEQFSRPFEYAPLRESVQLDADAPLRRSLALEPGEYTVSVEAFAPTERRDRPAAVLLALQPQGGEAATAGGPVGRVVEAPLDAELVVSGEGTQQVDLVVAPLDLTGEDPVPVVVHGWTLTRTN